MHSATKKKYLYFFVIVVWYESHFCVFLSFKVMLVSLLWSVSLCA